MAMSIELMNVEQARAFIDGNRPDEFTLLDVRQEWEYAEFHIPGAVLLPLVELPDRMAEVPRNLPVLVYCASGGRSMAAAVLLEGAGYPDIINLVGGAMSWQGGVAIGPMDLGMVEFSGNETPVEVVLKAYAMENSLQRFYIQRADVAETLERIELFMELAGHEDRHKDVLFRLYGRIVDRDVPREMFEEVAFQSVEFAAEGGVDIEEFFEENETAFDDEQGILQLAAMVEAQALDYYLRCAKRAENPEATDILQTLAREEKAHLKLLGRFMDRRDV